MANKKWQEANLAILIPALSELGTAQEEQIAQLCEKEIAGWRARPSIKKESALRPLMSASRKAIEERIKLTHDNRWKNPRSGKWEHLALKYMNFTEEEWRSLNAISDEKFQERQEQRQFIDHPAQIVARAEKLLSSNRWEDLVTGLAITTGRRLTEILKTARFFPKSLYSVTFDGQLKVRQDLDLKPYEIPLLCPAEVVIQAWRRLRSLEDCTGLDKDQVAQKYSRPANENVNYHFTGLIPQKTTRDKLTTHGMRGVYARIAVSWFCPATPVLVSDLSYVNAILGHWQATTERQMRDFATTEHYCDYVMGDGAGNIDGRQGIRLQEPGVEILEEFNHTKGTTMTDTTTTQEQAQNTQKGKAKSSASRTKEPKTRGTLTVQAGSYDIFCTKMEERGIHGDWKHDAMLVDVMNHDAVAHQMYTLLAPLSEDLGTDGPIATLQA